MLYLFTRNGAVEFSSTSDKEAFQRFSDASKDVKEGDALQVLQLQADVVHDRKPAPQQPAQGGAPLTADEAQQLRKLLDKMHAPAR